MLKITKLSERYLLQNTRLNYRDFSKFVKPFEQAEAEEIEIQKIENYNNLLKKKTKEKEKEIKWGDDTIYME